MKVSCLTDLLMESMMIASSQQVRACPVSRSPAGSILFLLIACAMAKAHSR